MALTDPIDGISGPRRVSGATALQQALASESAASLGRLGRAVERALATLRETPESTREDAEYACAEVVWMYFVQREVCGLTRHEGVIDAYAIPRSVLVKVGARRPSSGAV